jgi:hypothetical protein
VTVAQERGDALQDVQIRGEVQIIGENVVAALG